MAALKHLDLLVLALALPLFLAADFPILGWVTGAVAWGVQSVIKHQTESRALAIARRHAAAPPKDKKVAIEDMRKVAGLTAGSMIGRGWLCALVIFGGFFAAGQDDAVGLSSAVLVITCFTVYFSTAMVLRPFTDRELTS